MRDGLVLCSDRSSRWRGVAACAQITKLRQIDTFTAALACGQTEFREHAGGPTVFDVLGVVRGLASSGGLVLPGSLPALCELLERRFCELLADTDQQAWPVSDNPRYLFEVAVFQVLPPENRQMATSAWLTL